MISFSRRRGYAGQVAPITPSASSTTWTRMATVTRPRSAVKTVVPVHLAALEAAVDLRGTPTAHVTAQVATLVEHLDGELARSELQDAVGRTHREHFRRAYLLDALAANRKVASRDSRQAASGLQELRIYTVLGDDTNHPHSRRLKGFFERLHPSIKVVPEPMFVEDFLAVVRRGDL